MSANNQLIVIKNKEGKFEVHLHACVDNEFKPCKFSLIEIKDDLIKAIKFCNEYCAEELIEYGYYIGNGCLEENNKNEKS